MAYQSHLRNKSRRGDLNPGPADYESAALPLSYVGCKLSRNAPAEGLRLTTEQSLTVVFLAGKAPTIAWRQVSSRDRYHHGENRFCSRYGETLPYIECTRFLHRNR